MTYEQNDAALKTSVTMIETRTYLYTGNTGITYIECRMEYDRFGTLSFDITIP